MGVRVVARKGEPAEVLLRRFCKACEKAAVPPRRRRVYLSPSERRRLKSHLAETRRRRSEARAAGRG